MSIETESWRRDDGLEVRLQHVGDDLLHTTDSDWNTFEYWTYPRAVDVLQKRGFTKC